MKSSLTISLACMLAIGSLSMGIQSCKKGADDPFISFRSRKARVVGDWRIAQAKSTTNQLETLTNGSQTKTEIVVETDAGQTTATTTISGFPNSALSYDEETTYSFADDGTWSSEKKVVTTFIDTMVIGFNNDYYQQTTISNIVTESTGNWNFLGKLGEAKNKENIAIQTLTTKESATIDRSFVGITPGAPAFPSEKKTIITENKYSNAHEIWQLTELRNNKMAVSHAGTESYSKTINGDQSGSITESTFEGTLTLESK